MRRNGKFLGRGFYRGLALLAVGLTAASGRAAPPRLTILNPQEKFVPAAAQMPPEAYPEMPPCVVRYGATVKYLISTGWTVAANLAPGRSVARDKDAFNLATVRRTVACNRIEEDTPPAELLNPVTYWRRNYYGAFSAHVIERPEDKAPCLVTINHGENKNEKWEALGLFYPNTVLPARAWAKEQYSGWDAKGQYGDYWPAYFAFIGLSFCPLADNDGNRPMAYDQGPVLWPSTGYLDEKNNIVSCGLRHPSSIIHDGYLYIFYLEASHEKVPGEGRQAGIKLARAPLANLGRPGSFKCYFNGAFSEPALPAGFSRLERKFFSVPGGRSTALLPAEANRFSVARVKGTDWFVGVEEYQPTPGVFEMALRLSKDLIHWSARAALPGTRAPWGEGYHYPNLLSKELDDNTLVDAEEFYIGASSSQNQWALRRVSLRLEQKAEPK